MYSKLIHNTIIDINNRIKSNFGDRPIINHIELLYKKLFIDLELESINTTKPVTDKPVTTKPVTDKPVTTKPVTDKPVTDKPVTDKPVTDNLVELESDSDINIKSELIGYMADVDVVNTGDKIRYLNRTLANINYELYDLINVNDYDAIITLYKNTFNNSIDQNGYDQIYNTLTQYNNVENKFDVVTTKINEIIYNKYNKQDTKLINLVVDIKYLLQDLFKMGNKEGILKLYLDTFSEVDAFTTNLYPAIEKLINSTINLNNNSKNIIDGIGKAIITNDKTIIDGIDINANKGNIVFRNKKPLNIQIMEAPPITPMMTLTNNKRQELTYNMFIKSKNNVFKMLSIKNDVTTSVVEDIYNGKTTSDIMTKADIEHHVYKECDRMVDNYNKTH